MKYLLLLCAFVSITYANVDWISTDSHFTYAPASSWSILSVTGSSGCGSEFLLGPRNPGIVTFVFPQASTLFQWWGYQRSDGGKASICVDGATGSACSTANYFNASTDGSEPPRLLFSMTGLSNFPHTVIITNIADPTFNNQFGQLTVDRITISGTSAEGTPPLNAAGTTIIEVPMTFSYRIPLTLGGHSPPLNVLLDSGTSGAWVVWSGCTTTDCAGHNKYTPSTSNFHNFTHEDDTFVSAWRVNDTFTFGDVTTTNTFGAAFDLRGPQPLDGNFGVAKGFFFGLRCVIYPSFVETLYINGLISSPVLALYQLSPSDSPAAGVSSVAQVGGIDTNKFNGTIDWVPVNQQSMWQSPSPIRTVQVSSSNPVITPAFIHPVITFDTGDPGLLGIPSDDWIIFTAALGATEINGTWFFPCGSILNLNLGGSQGRIYTVALADPTRTSGGKCAALANDSGPQTNWIMGAPFLDQYYLIFYFSSNLMGFATKNLASNAASVQPLIGNIITPGLNGKKCLTAPSNSDGGIVTISDCNGSTSQLWIVAGGSIQIYGTKCLDVTNGSTTPGTKMQIFSCGPGNPNQQFTFTGDHRLAWINHPECLDVTNGNLANGNQMQMSTCTDNDVNHVWNIL